MLPSAIERLSDVFICNLCIQESLPIAEYSGTNYNLNPSDLHDKTTINPYLPAVIAVLFAP